MSLVFQTEIEQHLITSAHWAQDHLAWPEAGPCAPALDKILRPWYSAKKLADGGGLRPPLL